MDWFLYDRDLHHERVKVRTLKDRTSRLEVFSKKGVAKIFSKFTGIRRCRSLFSNKVADPRSSTLLKKRLRYRCSPVNFAKFLRTYFYIEHFQWLLERFFTCHPLYLCIPLYVCNIKVLKRILLFF